MPGLRSAVRVDRVPGMQPNVCSPGVVPWWRLMRPLFSLLPLAGSLVVLSLAPLGRSPRQGTLDTAIDEGPRRAAELREIRAHFDSVLVEVAARNVSALTSAQRARRTMLLTMLRQYRDRGEFPHNYDFPGRAVPYFVDRKTGALCAVGHLLASTGRRDIVDRVAATNVNVRVPQLGTDTAFTAWLAASGLTVAEAARIQPTYGGGGGVDTRSHAYTAASFAAVGASLGTMVWNATGNRDGKNRFGSALGIATGVAAVALGVASPTFSDAPTSLTVANMTVGAASVFVAGRSILRRQRLSAARRDAERASSTSLNGVEAVIAPTISMSGQRAAGLAVQLRF
jgi:hypothetical protein